MNIASGQIWLLRIKSKVELKSMDIKPGSLQKKFLTYLKLTKLKAGLMINFNEVLLKMELKKQNNFLITSALWGLLRNSLYYAIIRTFFPKFNLYFDTAFSRRAGFFVWSQWISRRWAVSDQAGTLPDGQWTAWRDHWDAWHGGGTAIELFHTLTLSMMTTMDG